uniref:Uncharacterized protein n=1 Tax=Malurus cyaneus samueli TaxID=2593467 RepID=A0A8C5U6W0_9PASS
THIVGSPFKAKHPGPRLVSSHSLRESSSVLVDSGVTGAPLRLGLSKGFVGQKNSFTVDCSKAGNNMLLVGVQGPRNPCEEIVVKHLGNQLYNVGYLLRERGDYVLVVKWGDRQKLRKIIKMSSCK